MNPPSVKIGLAVALALAAPLATALPEDRNQPIHLEASRGQLDQKTGISVYEGNVVITQGSMRLTADTVTIYVKDNNFQRMEATGAPANLRYRPTADKPEIQGASQRVEYDVAGAKVIMSGGANLKGDVVRARGAGDNGRIQFTIQPRTQESPAARKP
ncbi:MAG: lipopolysaccharide transport periplasmic protein LptA [Candidatus Contendobacter sp.]|nr:lipopolysaccharide transport periplasmic protein LptA [Candidatus Contendobacter sp.]